MQQRRRSKPRHSNSKQITQRISGVRVESLGHRGDGVARSGAADVYIPLAAPGDLLIIDVSGSRGEIVAIELSSDDRVVPPCALYGVCGGCALQHLSADYIERWKFEQLKHTLSLAGLDDVPIAPSQHVPDGSRRRAAFNFRRRDNRIELGFKARRSDKIVSVNECLLLKPKLNASISNLQELLGECLPEGAQGGALMTECTNGIAIDLEIVPGRNRDAADNLMRNLAGQAGQFRFDRISVNGEMIFERRHLTLDFDGLEVGFPIGGFLQPSKQSEVTLRTIVAAEIETRAKPNSKIVDLYAGAGALSLPLARSYKLSAYEGSPAAVEALSAAVRHSVGLKPVCVAVRDLHERPLVASELKGVGAVILDPPRSGAARQVEQLCKSQVPLIVYVSCNVATFARDCRTLVDSGFALEEVTPVDQFNYSPHLECVGILTRGR